MKIRRCKMLRCVAVACAVMLASGRSSEAFKLPDSDQRKCYQGVHPYGEIPCEGTGQDGDYNINPLSYTDNGNGTVSDNNTDLMWQQMDDGRLYNWFEATGIYDADHNPTSISVCGSLRLGGYTDWQLPSMKELMGIVDYDEGYPPGPKARFEFGFTKRGDEGYWSSSPREPQNLQNLTRHVNFGTGQIDNAARYYPAGLNRYVRCVRGEQRDTPIFADNGDGTVTDATTGLLWQRGRLDNTAWGRAVSYCNDLDLAGKSDWRLPTVKELASLLDYARTGKWLDPDFFPTDRDVNACFFWSSTSIEPDPHDGAFAPGAWEVNLCGAPLMGEIKYVSNFRYARCVRGGEIQPPPGLPNIMVTSPNGGERWRRGAVKTVTWETSAIGGYVTIQLLKDGKLHRTLTTTTENRGTFVWTVPGSLAAGATYRIKIIWNFDPQVRDRSDKPFSVY